MKKTMASRANPLALYDNSVYPHESYVGIGEDMGYALTGEIPLSLREDFGGSARACRAWIESDDRRTAAAVDLSPKLAAYASNVAWRGADKTRLSYYTTDVRESGPLTTGVHDVVMAMNCSWQCFLTKEDLRTYLAAVLSSLSPGRGCFVMDFFAGWGNIQPGTHKRKVDKDTTYVWDVSGVDPLTGRHLCSISYRFRDGSSLDDAFVYDWRAWSVPEVADLLREVGFSTVRTALEKDDLVVLTGRSSGLENEIAYLVAANV